MIDSVHLTKLLASLDAMADIAPALDRLTKEMEARRPKPEPMEAVNYIRVCCPSCGEILISSEPAIIKVSAAKVLVSMLNHLVGHRTSYMNVTFQIT